MKAILIMLFVCVTTIVIAQMPANKIAKVEVAPIQANAVYTPPINYAGTESKKAFFDAFESNTKQSGFCLTILSNACGSTLAYRVKKPVVPNDMKIRHYFGISYWD